MGFVESWLSEMWLVLCQSGPYLLVGFFLAGLLKVLVPQRWVWRHLGRDDLASVTKASLIGAPIPLCSCSVIPTAVALKKSGASKGATTSFLISTPETGVDSIGITWALIDPLMTIARPISAIATAIASGASVNLLVRRGWDVPTTESDAPENDAAEESAVEADCEHDHDHGPKEETSEPRSVGGSLRRGAEYAFGPLMADLTPWFVLGFACSGLIALLVPPDFFGGIVPTGLPAMLAMLVIGVPLYICATASTPVAAALMVKGLDPGAALVLLLAGPATNLATIGVVKGFLGGRVLAVYLGTIAALSLLAGWLLNLIYPGVGLDPRAVASAAGSEQIGALSQLAGFVLLALLVYHTFRERLDRRALHALARWLAPIGLDPTKTGMRIAAFATLLVAYASTGLAVVAPGEVAFLVRFGAVRAEWSEPGAYLHLPWPLERVERVRTDEVRGVSLGYDPEAGDEPPASYAALRYERAAEGARDFEAEAEVVTGDENILSVTYATQWAVADARSFRFSIDDPEELVRVVTMSAVRRLTASKTADELLVAHREALEEEVRALLQQELDGLDAGVLVVAVRLLDVHAPTEVHPAFRDVASALEDAQRDSLRAERYRIEGLSDTRAQAWERVQAELAQKAQALAVARGDAAAFTRLLDTIGHEPTATIERLRLEAAARTLSAARLVFVLGTGIDVELLESSTPPDDQERYPPEGGR